MELTPVPRGSNEPAVQGDQNRVPMLVDPVGPETPQVWKSGKSLKTTSDVTIPANELSVNLVMLTFKDKYDQFI